MNRIYLVLSTFFGLGLVPGAPGTVGTLGAVGIVYLLNLTGNAIFYCAVTLILIAVSFRVSGRAALIFKREDPPQVVIDEVCGFCVCMLFVKPEPVLLALGFFLFRFFDIAKPFPVKKLERLRGGYGIVMDDVAAGVYANLCLQAYIFFPKIFSG